MSATPRPPENRETTTPATTGTAHDRTAPLTFGGGTDAIPAMFTVKERQWRCQQGR